MSDGPDDEDDLVLPDPEERTVGTVYSDEQIATLENRSYARGKRQAALDVFTTIFRYLDPAERDTAAAHRTLAEVYQTLRDVTDEYGDPNWDEEPRLHPSDVITNHLVKPMAARIADLEAFLEEIVDNTDHHPALIRRARKVLGE